MQEVFGQKFGKLTVIKEVPSKVRGHRQYECLCDCGGTHIGTRNNILRGITSQCTQCSKTQRAKAFVVNGANSERYTYNSWRSMIDRCANHARYRNVQICEQWQGPLGFVQFLKDMGQRPGKHTLDRIDNSRGYSPDNCRWATVGLQNHNKGKKRTAITSRFIGVCLTPRGWYVQFCYEGSRVRGAFSNEEDAAVFYDNISEQYYGDRPNKTVRREVHPRQNKIGGIIQAKSGSWRVRATVNGKRKHFGQYKTKEEAEEVLDLILQMLE
jgi:hypothetical protein